MGILQRDHLLFAELGDGPAYRLGRQAEVIGDVGTIHRQANQPVGSKGLADPVEQQAEESRDLFAGEPAAEHQEMVLQHADLIKRGRHDHRMKQGIAVGPRERVVAMRDDLGLGHGIAFRRMPAIAWQADQVAGKTKSNHLPPTILVQTGQADDARDDFIDEPRRVGFKEQMLPRFQPPWQSVRLGLGIGRNLTQLLLNGVNIVCRCC